MKKNNKLFKNIALNQDFAAASRYNVNITIFQKII